MTALLDCRFEEDEAGEYASGVHRSAPSSRSPFDLPDVPGLERVPKRLAAADEADLRWRLTDPKIAAVLGSSGMGPSLERSESYGYGALPCRRCGGRWKKRQRVRDGTEVVINWRDGTGWKPKSTRNGRNPTYAAALAAYRVEEMRRANIVVISHHAPESHVRDATVQAFWDRGQQVVTPSELREMFPRLPEERCVPCDKCQGIGVVPRRNAQHAEVTAWPRGSSVRPGGREGLDADELAAAFAERDVVRDACAVVSLDELERFHAVELLLRDVATLAPIGRLALEAYYSPTDQPNQIEATIGRAVIAHSWERLTELTPAANEARRLRGAERLWQARMASQAADLYTFACSCWNLVAYGS